MDSIERTFVLFYLDISLKKHSQQKLQLLNNALPEKQNYCATDELEMNFGTRTGGALIFIQSSNPFI